MKRFPKATRAFESGSIKWLVAALGFVLCPELHGQIQVRAGTYGGNAGAPHGNVTSQLAAACNGGMTCNYSVSYLVLGDPVPGVAKDYVAQWQCGGDGTVRNAYARPEAGFGSIITLACTSQIICYYPYYSVPPATDSISNHGTSAGFTLGVSAPFGGIGVDLALINMSSPSTPLHVLEARSAAGCGFQFADWSNGYDGSQALTNQAVGNSAGSQWGFSQHFSASGGTALYATDFAPRYSDSFVPANTSEYVSTTPCPNPYPIQPANFNSGGASWRSDLVQTVVNGVTHNVVRLTASYSLMSTFDEHWLHYQPWSALYLSSRAAHDGDLTVYLYGQGGWIEGPLAPQSLTQSDPIIPSFSVTHGTLIQGQPDYNRWWEIVDSSGNYLKYVLLVYQIAGGQVGIAVPMHNQTTDLWASSRGYCLPSAEHSLDENLACGSINLSTRLNNQVSVSFLAGSVRTYSQEYYVGSPAELISVMTPTTACSSFTISPTSASPTSGAGSQIITITGVPAGCTGGSWGTSGNGSWLTVSPTSGSGSGSVTANWAANPSSLDRSGSATIAGHVFVVNQAGPTPTVTSISPGNGPMAGGTSVTITGLNFRAGAAVSIGGSGASITSISPTSIVARTGASACGTYSVVVTEGSVSGTLTNGFFYTSPQAPTGLSPNGTSLAATTAVTLSWTSVSGATQYGVRLQDNTDGTIRYGGNNCPTNTIYVCVDGWHPNTFSASVTPGHSYTWWVHSGSACGQYSGPTYGSFSVLVDSLHAPTALFKEASPSMNLVWTPPNNLTPGDAVTYNLWLTGGTGYCAAGCLFHPAAPSWYTIGPSVGSGNFTWRLQAVSASRSYAGPVTGPGFTLP